MLLPDTIYVAASALDFRFTRICIASVRYFYPDISVQLLAGGELQRGLAEELRRYYSVGTAPLAAQGDYGWGYVKLEPLFGPPGEKFLVLDSDTVLTGPVLDSIADCAAPFIVDDEKQSDADARRLYYDWDKLRAIDSSARAPGFLFNSGQWFGTAGVLKREDFAPWVEWTMPRRLRHPGCFMPGDQGVLNYVLNQRAALAGLQVERRKIMRWPGHGLQGLDTAAVSARTAETRVVHWAGMKKMLQRNMVGADLLAFFEDEYYRRLGAGAARKFIGASRHLASQLGHHYSARFRR